MSSGTSCAISERLPGIAERPPSVIARRAAVVAPVAYEQWKCGREAFFDHLHAIAERANVPSDEAEALAGEAVRAVRGR
jgi:hypothetical protein